MTSMAPTSGGKWPDTNRVYEEGTLKRSQANTTGFRSLRLPDSKNSWVMLLVSSTLRTMMALAKTLIGWMSTLGWLASVSSSVFVMTSLIEAIIDVSNADYLFKPWQYTLIMLAFLVVTIFFNTWGAKILPKLEILSLFGHLGGFFVVMIPLLVIFDTFSPWKVIFLGSCLGIVSWDRVSGSVTWCDRLWSRDLASRGRIGSGESFFYLYRAVLRFDNILPIASNHLLELEYRSVSFWDWKSSRLLAELLKLMWVHVRFDSFVLARLTIKWYSYLNL